MFDFGGGGNFSANLDAHVRCLAGVGFDRRGCTGRMENYVINRIS
jgi:hypothetical protein